MMFRFYVRFLGCNADLGRELPDHAAIQGMMRLHSILCSDDSLDRKTTLAAAHMKHLRPKRDYYHLSKLKEIGGRSIAVTAAMSNLYYKNAFSSHLQRHQVYPFMTELDSSGYVIPGTSPAGLVVHSDPSSHKSLFTLGEGGLGHMDVTGGRKSFDHCW